MGRPFLIYLDESNQGADYYQCRACKAHIALVSDVSCTYWPGLNGMMGGIFKKIVNGYTDESAPPVYLAPPEVVVPHKVLEIHCNQCMDILGWKYVELSEEAEAFIHEGDIEMRMEKLEEHKNRTVAADQQQQAPRNVEDAEMAEQGEQQEDAEMSDSEDSYSDSSESDEDII